MDERALMKIVVLSCGAYPKPGAPHRLSIEDDFERCCITGISGLTTLLELVERLEMFSRGSIALGDVGLGKSMAHCVSEAVKELGHGLVLEIALALPIATAMYWFEKHGEGPSMLERLVKLSPPEDARELVEALRAIGGEYALEVEKVDLSGRRVVVEGMGLDEVIQELSRGSRRYAYVLSTDVYGFVSDVAKLMEKGWRACEALAYTYVSLLESEGLKGVKSMFLRKALADLIKLDIELRKRGSRYSYLMPPVLYSTSIAIARGLI